MSRIFALVTVSSILLAGGIAVAVAHDGLEDSSGEADAIAELFASGLDVAVVVPIVLAAGLLLATLGVLARR